MPKFNSGRFKGTRGSSDTGYPRVRGFTTQMNRDRQGKHVPKHKNYNAEAGRSFLSISMEHAQELIMSHGGKGTWHGANKETVDFGEIIGSYVDRSTGARLKTTRGTIHYSKAGAHIVPAHPKGR